MSLGGILMVDADGDIRYWNEDAEEIFGYGANEVIGESMELLIAESYRERHWKGFKKAMTSGKVAHDQLMVNVPIRSSDGKIGLFPVREILLRDAFRASVGVVTIFSPACKEGKNNGLPTIYADALTN